MTVGNIKKQKAQKMGHKRKTYIWKMFRSKLIWEYKKLYIYIYKKIELN